ncbi:CDP-diacylglycerol--serine O-phosphatidyltransferase [Candidatus Dependentiae bacterium]|nr:CDP-diacylglycerol--serine O-phosphatidyltransferase [Candidatus Dependentiae bacterium]
MVIINRIEQSSNVGPSNHDVEQRIIDGAPLPKEKRRRLRRSLKLLPNLFTLGNAFFGFCALIFAAHNHPQAAAYCILLGASMDALDGRIARLTNSTSPLGMQLDSLADAVTFCVAPAFVIYMLNFHHGYTLGFLSCAFYMLAGIFRLARFNITHQAQSSFFLGLPTTFAGCALALSILSFSLSDHLFFMALLMINLGYLMVSRWRFPSFKHASKKWLFPALIIIGVVIATFEFNKVLLGLYGAYLLLGFISTFWLRHFNKSS